MAHQVGAIAVIAEMFPTLTPTSEFAAAGLPAGLPGWLNTLSFKLVQAGLRAMGSPAAKLAKRFGVVNITPDLTLCPVSPTLVPRPADWPEWAFITGHWSLPFEADLDQELEAFLSSGPVLYAGFGSMKDSLAAKRAEAIVTGAKQAGLKVLLVTGWGGLAPSLAHVEDPDVLVRGSVPHSLVFPRVALVMHHGGAGTTHQAVAAGVVSVIMPFLADQPWWANRLHSLGLGPKPLSRKTTNPKVIAKTLLAAPDYSDAVKLAASNMTLDSGLSAALTVLVEAERGQLELRPS
jgi:sterol 3beta-glucosyltransferase